MNRAALVNQIRITDELLRRKSRTDFSLFVPRMKEDYSMQWFHRYICEKLNAFAGGEIKNLMILMPPQTGKSALASRLFPPFYLGQRPDARVGLITYNDTFAQKFNREIQRYIDSIEYSEIFPGTQLNNSKLFGTKEQNYVRNNRAFDVVGRQGALVSVGRGGQITGLPMDLLIMDDLYKNREEAISQTVSEKIWTDYNDVFKTRLHNGSQQLMMNTRWDDADLAGRLLLVDPDSWEVIKFPAIRTEDVMPYDPREVGEVLWPERHSLERMLEIERTSEVTFNSLYQQDPKPNESLLVYPKVIEIPEWPREIETKYWGLDFGFTNDPTALVKCADVGRNSFFDLCCYEPGIPMEYIKEVLLNNGYVEGEPVFCDHVPTAIAELRRLKVAAFPAVKGADSLQAGISKMKEFQIHVTARSTQMLLERRKYQWVAYGTTITNIPIDAWNHAWDAGRYGLYTKHFR